MSPSDELDQLYTAKPGDFTTLRSKLAAAAKQRGDAEMAKQISAARKPTTAAWIVNLLALRHKKTKQRLSDLGDRLRAAHAEMDGERIRSLSMQQHHLINELTAAAFEAAEVNPSAALRDDVTDTLQAAIADPEVTLALGRLAKAEHWSGFGGFGEMPKAEPKDNAETAHWLQQALAAAEQEKAEADDALSERQHELESARQRHDEARRNLRDAERDLSAAERAYDRAKSASRDAAESVRDARARLREH